MRPRMPLNENGMTIIAILMVVTVVGIAASTILAMSVEKRKISNRLNVSASANLAKQKLVGAVMSPASWQLTQSGNASAFASFAGGAPSQNALPTLKIYIAGMSTPYYQPSNDKAGFDLTGAPCTSFDSVKGNDSCPLRYDVKLKSHVFQNSNWIDTVHFELSFKPKSTDLVFNAKASEFTFDLTRNLDDKSVESACISISGAYDAASNSCSVRITTPVATCASGKTYRGPASNSTSTNCDTKSLTVTTCASNQVVKTFDGNGNPVCGVAI